MLVVSEDLIIGVIERECDNMEFSFVNAWVAGLSWGKERPSK